MFTFIGPLATGKQISVVHPLDSLDGDGPVLSSYSLVPAETDSLDNGPVLGSYSMVPLEETDIQASVASTVTDISLAFQIADLISSSLCDYCLLFFSWHRLCCVLLSCLFLQLLSVLVPGPEEPWRFILYLTFMLFLLKIHQFPDINFDFDINIFTFQLSPQ